jgi:hypothetical protein
MTNRFANIACVVMGILVALLSLRLLSQHQYVTARGRLFGEEPKTWIPTFVPLLLGVWLSLIGVVGLVDEKRRNKSK